VRILPETIVGKVGEFISFQIQDRYGLVLMTLLRAISVVQRRGVAIVWTQRNRGGKTIYRSDPAGGVGSQPLAGWKRQVTRFSRILRRKPTHSSDGEQQCG